MSILRNAALVLTGLSIVVQPAAAASELLYLAEDVPAGLDFEGPSSSTNTSQVGFINMSEPLVSFAQGSVNAEGIQTLDFTKFV